MELIVATGNPDKLKQLRTVIPDGIQLRMRTQGEPGRVDPEPLPGNGPVRTELGRIAAAKATTMSRKVPGGLVVATDGGLLIPALAGWRPGLTRRFAGSGASDEDRVAALLALAANLNGDQRRIGWCEALAIARDGRVVFSGSAESGPGWLSTEPLPAGSGNGFWVPRLWRDDPGAVAHPGAWDRLGQLVGPYLAGFVGAELVR